MKERPCAQRHCSRQASVACCTKRLCTWCYFTSEHVRHTGRASVFQVARCGREISAEVEPAWEALWHEVASEVVQEAEADARKAAADPLGHLFAAGESRAVSENLQRPAKKRAAVGLAELSLDCPRGENLSKENDIKVIVSAVKPRHSDPGWDILRRSATRPRDIWNHSGTIEPAADGANRGNHDSRKLEGCETGPPCPVCDFTETVRMEYEDRGRKGEIWGSHASEDRITRSCRSCGHRWSTED